LFGAGGAALCKFQLNAHFIDNKNYPIEAFCQCRTAARRAAVVVLLGVRVEHLEDLEILAFRAIPKENPERFTPDFDRDHPQIGGLTPPSCRPAR